MSIFSFFQFCCWENPTFSHAVLHELLWQIAIAYTHELRPYLDLLLAVLQMEDSWQIPRIQKSLRGIPDDHSAREGIFDTISRYVGKMMKHLKRATGNGCFYRHVFFFLLFTDPKPIIKSVPINALNSW